MNPARQFDLTLTRPGPLPKPQRRLPTSDLTNAKNKVLTLRRWRLCRLVERTQATLAEIEAELRRRGATIDGPPKRRPRDLPFRHNELPRLCLNALRVAGRPMHVREIAATVLSEKDLDPLDRALADLTVHRVRDVLLHLRRKDIVQMIGALHSTGSRWALLEHDCL